MNEDRSIAHDIHMVSTGCMQSAAGLDHVCSSFASTLQTRKLRWIIDISLHAPALIAILYTTPSLPPSLSPRPPGTMPIHFTGYTAQRVWRWTLRFLRNTRISPIATYLAYKSSGYADQGTLAGMTISDFVSVWTPYNNNEAPKDILGREKKNLRCV